FVTIPIKRNMAAGHHDAAFGSVQGIARQRRSGNMAEEHRSHTTVGDGLSNGLGEPAAWVLPHHNLGGTGPQIAGVEELFTSHNAALRLSQRLKVFQFSEGIEVYLQLRQVGNQSTPPTSAELQGHRVVIQTGA